MPFYKVLGGRWGEGHQPGDIIELDTEAAVKRVEDGEIEETNTSPKVAEEKEGKDCCGSKGTRCLKDCSTKEEETEEGSAAAPEVVETPDAE